MKGKMITINDHINVEISLFQTNDFQQIQTLNEQEGWMNLVEKHELTRQAWEQSNIKYTAKVNNQLVGYIRGLTDQYVTLYICELLINKNFRGEGLGTELLSFVHNLYPTTRIEMLASSSSHTYYEKIGYRPFYGFRKTKEE